MSPWSLAVAPAAHNPGDRRLPSEASWRRQCEMHSAAHAGSPGRGPGAVWVLAVPCCPSSSLARLYGAVWGGQMGLGWGKALYEAIAGLWG